jgi:hypothetical protein
MMTLAGKAPEDLANIAQSEPVEMCRDNGVEARIEAGRKVNTRLQLRGGGSKKTQTFG